MVAEDGNFQQWLKPFARSNQMHYPAAIGLRRIEGRIGDGPREAAAESLKRVGFLRELT
jgi:uncharacterized protein YfeS